jgi:hypothetical protein
VDLPISCPCAAGNCPREDCDMTPTWDNALAIDSAISDRISIRNLGLENIKVEKTFR